VAVHFPQGPLTLALFEIEGGRARTGNLCPSPFMLILTMLAAALPTRVRVFLRNPRSISMFVALNRGPNAVIN
jgi:hypothetical protein